ncbi:MAG: hypothetical protein E7301_00830 [Butyrivibrio sp.]|nr:hypothetical protein [Butyrivibrio sp.]
MSNFSIVPDNMKTPIIQLGESSKKLHHYAGEIDYVKNSLNSSLGEMVPVLDALKLRTLDHSTSVQTLGVVLGAVVKEYKDHEQNVYGNTQSNKSGSNPFNVMRTSCVVAAADGCGGGGTTVNQPKGPWDDIDDNDLRKKAWEALPDELKDLIGPDDIMVADDGSVIFTKSFVDLLKANGANEETLKYFEAYDDWYLMGIPDGNDGVVYTMFKYRELTDSQKGKGTRLPFIALNMDDFASYFGNAPGRPTADQLETIVKVCTNAEDYQSQYSQRLLDYFKDPESDASYLMADFVSAKAAEQLLDENGQYTIPYKYGDFDGAGKKALRHFEDLKMYDKKTGTITIDTSDGLSQEEKRLLLLVTTGDPDEYSFAAENQYHADKFNTDKADEGKNTNTNNSAIASDAGVGESTWGWTYEGKFRKKSGNYYKQQYNAHKDD